MRMCQRIKSQQDATTRTAKERERERERKWPGKLSQGIPLLERDPPAQTRRTRREGRPKMCAFFLYFQCWVSHLARGGSGVECVCVCGREQDRLIYCSGSGSSECIIGGFLAPWQDTCFPLVLHDPLSLIGIDDFFESSDLEGMFPFSLVEELDIHPLPSQLRSQV